MGLNAAKVSLVVSCYFGAGNASLRGFVPEQSLVGGSATILSGVQKESLNTMAENPQSLKEVATRPALLGTHTCVDVVVVRKLVDRGSLMYVSEFWVCWILFVGAELDPYVRRLLRGLW